MIPSVNQLTPNTGRFLDETDIARNIVEAVTGAIKTITSDHAAIHKGEGFGISGIFSGVANSSTVNYAFKTPSVASGKHIHLKYKDIQATANKIRVDLYEAPTNAPTNGTDLTPVNRNRVGTPTATSMQAVKSGMTLDLTGATLLNSEQFVSNQARSLDIEYVLKPNTWYVRTFTNGTGGAADISFFEFWYEEPSI